MRTYTYENHAILIDKLCIYQYPLDDQRFLQDTPVASHLDVTGLQKVDTIIADDATQFERYKNENGEIICEAGKYCPICSRWDPYSQIVKLVSLFVM